MSKTSEIYKDQDFRKYMNDILYIHKSMTRSLSFTHYDHDSQLIEKFHETIRQFVKHFEIKVSDNDFLDAIVKVVDKIGQQMGIETPLFLIKIALEVENETKRYNIIRYMIHKIPIDQLKEYKTYFRFTFQDPKIYLDYLDLFCDLKYEFLYEEVSKWGRHVSDVTLAYINVRRDKRVLEKKIEDLQLQLKYMPGGEGYEEAKKEFEDLVVDQS